eukprot:gnl/Chilomastix_caulleri/2237.p1 GENE.gnl/Chilomastix_caulleri/2237~~gnl/Chilomastix_caulleri/2237.p1  ORF type:complete len:69 (+),score=2.68 gnl/Chilomastix_caulleri/2237:223-429(+)
MFGAEELKSLLISQDNQEVLALQICLDDSGKYDRACPSSHLFKICFNDNIGQRSVSELNELMQKLKPM